MKKVLVIGCPGAGKSTFARRLSAATGLPLHYLDMVWHRPDRTNVSTGEFDAALGVMLRADEWIIDGNYLRTLPERLRACDTVFFFDLPVEVCLRGAVERLGQPREDMPWTDTELDEDFRRWILDFPTDQQPVIEDLLAGFGGRTVRFSSREEADAFIRNLTDR